MPYYIVLWVMLMAWIVLLVQEWGIKTGMHNWQTMVFVILALAQLANVFVRANRDGVDLCARIVQQPAACLCGCRDIRIAAGNGICPVSEPDF